MSDYLLFSSIVLTKGNSRSILHDLQREKISFIPNSLFDILQNDTLNINELKKKYAKNKDEEITLQEYFDFLIENEFIFKVSAKLKDSFPRISEEYEYPFEISNAIVDIKNTLENIDEIFFKLENAKIFNIQVRIIESLHKDKFIELLEKFNYFNFRSVSIICGYNQSLVYEVFEKVYNKYRFLHSIIIHSYLEKEFDLYNDNSTKIIYSNQIISGVNNCGCISPEYFTINEKHYFESQNHNTCLNKKLSIDINGNIKNCPSMLENFGNIKNSEIKDVINKPNFKKYWNIKKDDIAVCKDCEFRHICTDCRAYLENPNDIYSKPLKCGYNPYNNHWDEWASNPLKQKALEFYDLKQNLTANL